MKYMKIIANSNLYSIINIDDNDENVFKQWQKETNSNMVEVLHPVRFNSLAIICDEEARLKKYPVINEIATLLYSKSRTFIYGDILIGKCIYENGEELIKGFDENDILLVEKILNTITTYYENLYKGQMKSRSKAKKQ